MSVQGLERLLEQHPFFQGMDSQYHQLIVGCAANERFNAGEYIFREGEAANKFYLIRHGSIALEIHRPGRESLMIDTLYEGDILGWSWLIPPYHCFLDARATQLTRLVSLDAQCLRGKMEDDHELGYELYQRFMPIIAQRLHAAQLQMIDMYAAPRGGG